jgi:hypothetical protein
MRIQVSYCDVWLGEASSEQSGREYLLLFQLLKPDSNISGKHVEDNGHLTGLYVGHLSGF